MNISRLETLLKSHDWYFEMSDSQRVWRKGMDHKREIEREIKLFVEAGEGEKAFEIFKKHSPDRASLTKSNIIVINFT